MSTGSRHRPGATPLPALALLALTLVATTPLAATGQAPRDRPNFVFILADDLGWRDLSCYGSTFHETPNLDRLAREGLRFTQAYAAGSVCSPTRSSILTGKLPVRTGVTNVPGLAQRGRKLATRPAKKHLALEEVTLAEALRDAGYQTFYAGKWHLGERGFGPVEQGFDVHVTDSRLGNLSKDWQVGQKLSQAAERFLDERDAARPFFLFLGYHEPHTPILEYPGHITRFRDKLGADPPAVQSRAEHVGRTRTVQDDPAYASEVAGLDAFVGSVLAKLEEKGLADDTVVVFSSDNGGLSTGGGPGPTSNEPLRAGKGWLYEGGIRVPLIVRAPGVTRAGTTSDAPVLSTDFYPTMLELAGLPARPEQHRDGQSLAPLLRGEAPPRRDAFFWHYPHYHGSTWAPGGAMREGAWKLVEFFEDGSAELYDLESDPSEQRNLAATQTERLEAMRKRLAAWRTETGAFVPALVEAPGESAPGAPEEDEK